MARREGARHRACDRENGLLAELRTGGSARLLEKVTEAKTHHAVGRMAVRDAAGGRADGVKSAQRGRNADRAAGTGRAGSARALVRLDCGTAHPMSVPCKGVEGDTSVSATSLRWHEVARTTPMIDPFMATSAPSPPLDPPGLSLRFSGLCVRPKRWLKVSPICTAHRQLRVRENSIDCGGAGSDGRGETRRTMRV